MLTILLESPQSMSCGSLQRVPICKETSDSALVSFEEDLCGAAMAHVNMPMLDYKVDVTFVAIV